MSFVPTALPAQLFERATVIENVSLRVSSDRVIPDCRIVVKGGRIAEIGSDVEKPMLSRTIDGRGMTVTAGLVDVGSGLALDRMSRGNPVARAADGFDHYDRDTILEALAGGVTSVCLVPSGSTGILGNSSVVRLAPRAEGGFGTTIEGGEALCIDLGSGLSPVSRMKSFLAVRKTFRDALLHRDALDAYDDALEEYIEALEEAAKGEKKGEEKGQEKGEEKEKPAEEKGGSGASAPGGNGGKGGEKKDEGPKKPDPPPRKPEFDRLLEAVDRSVPVRIVAHRSSDILNALDLAEEFGLDWVLEGASEAHLVLEELREAEVPVVLDPVPEGESGATGPARRRPSDLAARLTRAGLEWHFAGRGRAPELWWDAADAARGSGRDPSLVVGGEAARFLGLGRGFGRLGRGTPADIVMWSADPVVDPAARVHRVWVGGASVYQDPDAAPDEPADGERKEL